MRIAIMGATSQIAKDLIESFAAQNSCHLVLYARRPEAVREWLANIHLADRYAVHDFANFGVKEKFDAILNFVGIGNPAQAAAMGAGILDVTIKYDNLAINYVRQHPACRYIFLSSGAAYGSNFDAPADNNTFATFPINDLTPQDWYGMAKLQAECRHRSLKPLPIVDIRLFNYFSHTQNINSRFFITDILRAIRDKTVLKTSNDLIVRDFIHPSDFYRLVVAILTSPATNVAVDTYSKEAVDKSTLLAKIQERFGLQYQIIKGDAGINATGNKRKYYSLNTRAASFGYAPKLNSLEGLIVEIEIWMKKENNKRNLCQAEHENTSLK